MAKKEEEKKEEKEEKFEDYATQREREYKARIAKAKRK